jgi:hypothetical protein
MREEQLKGALRALLLPIRPELEMDAIAAAGEALAKGHVAEADCADFMRIEAEQWRLSPTHNPGEIFANVVRAYLRAGDPGDIGDRIATQYFAMHKNLAERPQFEHSLASALLSHARLIAVLGVQERLSSAQISQLLSQRDSRLPGSWEAIQSILSSINNRPELVQAQVEELFALDVGLEEEWFGDADRSECIKLIGRMASSVGLGGEFEEALNVLVLERFPPHLKMLHFLCFIAEYYDHPLQFAYEFKPRGKVAKWVAEQYPGAFGRTGSPFLNNAKSVDVLDRGWANSKKRAISRQAHALVTVVDSLSGLGFSARRELATWIRRLLVRVIRLESDIATDLPKFGPAEVEKIIAAVCEGPTNTFGILEQRVVDAVSALSHGPPVWVARGLTDSVNTTNISRRKCGDCDFQDTESRLVKAFEPHAGSLTDIYVKDHKLTLERVLVERGIEWEQTVSENSNWTVIVTFVAHEIPQMEVGTEVHLPGVTAEINAITFEDFMTGVELGSGEALSMFAEYVRAPLMDERTPETVRRRVSDLIA